MCSSNMRAMCVSDHICVNTMTHLSLDLAEQSHEGEHLHTHIMNETHTSSESIEETEMSKAHLES